MTIQEAWPSCMLYAERLSEQTLDIAIFLELIFAMAELEEGADFSLQFRRLCFEGYHLSSFTSLESILISLILNSFVFITLTYSDGHSSLGNTEMSADFSVSLLNSSTGFSCQLL